MLLPVASNPQEDDHHKLIDQCSGSLDDENDNVDSNQLYPLLDSSPNNLQHHGDGDHPDTSKFQNGAVPPPTPGFCRMLSYSVQCFCQPVVRVFRKFCCYVTPATSNSSTKKSNSICTMHCIAPALVWGTITALLFAIFWYSYELFNHGTEPHLIAWFSAGAFVLLGFPVSMYGIISHLTNYNAPHIQVYVVRILWMVPIYSVESWLAMRFHKQAVFIETARDVYESFVLYCFLQFLIQVLGGEQALILLLKDKSPTRGVHMCYGLDKVLGFKPWLMGQPIRRSIYVPTASSVNDYDAYTNTIGTTTAETHRQNEDDIADHDDTNSTLSHRASVVERVTAALSPAPKQHHRFFRVVHHQTSSSDATLVAATVPGGPDKSSAMSSSSPYYRVYWTSPFFIQCKFGVLQYVLIKLFCAVAVLILEYYGWYKEGQFHFDAGYLYICILTNVSQCYALYCLVFFYFATKNELSPIRPVGKFLSVKALVFFTWWQSVLISVMYQLKMIPNYKASNTEKNLNPEDVAKGIQDYCICIEMFVAAIVHSFVFPHSEYSVAAVRAREQVMGTGQVQYDQFPHNNTLDESGRMIYYNTKKRLGRRAARQHPRLKPRSEIFSSHLQESPATSQALPNSDSNLELTHFSKDNNKQAFLVASRQGNQCEAGLYDTNEQLTNAHQLQDSFNHLPPSQFNSQSVDKDKNESSTMLESSTTKQALDSKNNTKNVRNDQNRPGLFRAFIDTAIPRDLHDNTVNLLLQRGEYTSTYKTTLLHHAATSDQYDLFAKNNHLRQHSCKERGLTRLHDSKIPAATANIDNVELSDFIANDCK